MTRNTTRFAWACLTAACLALIVGFLIAILRTPTPPPPIPDDPHGDKTWANTCITQGGNVKVELLNGKKVVAKGATALDGSYAGKVKAKFTSAGKKALAKKRSVKLTVRVTWTPGR